VSKPRRKGVDMSLPPEERGRRRTQGPVGGTPVAQLGRAGGSRAARHQREGARKLDAMAALHGDTARYTAWIAGMDPADYPDLIRDRIEDAAG
jgi:hypothetical protein